MTHHPHVPTSAIVAVLSVALIVIILRRLMMNSAARATGGWAQSIRPGLVLVYTPSKNSAIRRIYLQTVEVVPGRRTFINPSGLTIKYVYLLPVAPGSGAEAELVRLCEEKGESVVQIDGWKYLVDDHVNEMAAEEGWLHAKIVHPSRVSSWRPRVRWVAE
jgi:hypothetical protein